MDSPTRLEIDQSVVRRQPTDEEIRQIIEQFRAAYFRSATSNPLPGPSVEEIICHFREVFADAEVVRHKLEEIFEELHTERHADDGSKEEWRPQKPR